MVTAESLRSHFRRIAIPLLLGFGSAPARAQDVVHHISSDAWSKNPATDSGMTARLTRAATEYRQYAPVPRVAFYDIGYPSSADEYRALNGFGAILVTVMAQDSAELPLARLYFRDASGTITELPKIVSSCGRLSSSDSIVSGTFGSNRCDALHLFPVILTTTAGELLADFAIHRNGFRLGNFTGEVTQVLKKLPIGPPGQPPAATVANPVFAREFPIFRPLLNAN